MNGGTLRYLGRNTKLASPDWIFTNAFNIFHRKAFEMLNYFTYQNKIIVQIKR
ncbi:hypothetical protein PAN31108_04303 [Pandoraea anhela]|uniref:Uncharacterized protein n=1 Tax=Pandoraea anhela TaxID=2508295 RepID=A0A5E4Y6F4_9BURK|nr:hypothetical protein PAN31108_04303 [Pandoraea anhela]